MESGVAEHQALRSEILELSGDIKAAKAEREQRRQTESLRPAAPLMPMSYEERRRALVGDEVPDPHERLNAYRAAMEADLEHKPPKVVVSDDEKRARDAEAVKARLAKNGFTIVQEPRPGVPYTGSILLATDFHVAQHAGRDGATLHDKRQLQQDYQVGDKPRIIYGADHRQQPLISSKPRGLRR